MHHDITAEDILRSINFKQAKSGLGTAIDISARTSNRSREQLNNKTIKELNNSSRTTSEDDIDVQSPLRETPSSGCSHKSFGSSVTPARTNNPRYSCVIVQHARTAKGVKLAITLQTEESAVLGKKLKVTAELKRYDRLREVKARLEDSDQFNLYFEDTKRDIHAAKDKSICMGRMHRRGKRSQWLQDTLVVAVLSDQGIVSKAILNIDHEEYEIDLDGELTDLQKKMYHATGQIGTFQNGLRQAPRMSDLEWEDC
jgi:hypothetical protein